MLLAWPGTGWDWNVCVCVCVWGGSGCRECEQEDWRNAAAHARKAWRSVNAEKTRITRAPTRETNLIVKSHLQIAVHREMGETKSTQKQAKMSFSLKALSILL